VSIECCEPLDYYCYATAELAEGAAALPLPELQESKIYLESNAYFAGWIFVNYIILLFEVF